MTTAKKPLLMLFQLALLYIFAASVSAFAPEVFWLHGVSTLVLMTLSLKLLMYFAEHIIDRTIRRHLVGIAGLITLWIVLRGAKYIAFEETEPIARHIWYCYYAPILLIPMLSLLSAISVARQGKEKTTKATAQILLPLVLTGILLAFVLTNDAHQLVFRFHPDFALWDSDYSYGPLFIAVYVWTALLLLGTVCILFSYCRVSTSRRLIWVPLLPTAFGAIYMSLYTLDLWPRINGGLFGEFPEAVCFTVGGLWMSLIYIGLIQSNEGYGKLFEASSLAAQIADSDYRVIYQSANAAQLSLEQLTSEPPVSLNRNTRLHRRPVYGGYVYWQDDIAELNRINEELWEAGERLAEEVELVRLENELKEERAQIDAKTKVYDEIAAKVLPQSQKIAALCVSAERNPASFSQCAKTVCLLAAYIKRYANLSLLASEQAELATGELHLAISESLRYARGMGISAESVLKEEMLLPANKLLAAYALFETFLEQAAPTMRAVRASIRGMTMKLAIEGAGLSVPEGCGAELSVERGVSCVSLDLGKAGGAE